MTQYVNVVAHSMGGLITRFAIYAVSAKLKYFPSKLFVHNVVALETPFGGADYSHYLRLIYQLRDVVHFIIFFEHEMQQMLPASLFIQNVYNHGILPQANGGTHWALVGMDHYGSCTNIYDVVAADSAVFMSGADTVVYENPCYHHVISGISLPGNLDMMADTSNQLNAVAYSCLLCHINNQPYFWRYWSESITFPHSLQYVLNSLNYNSVQPTPSPTLTPTTSPTPVINSPSLSEMTAISTNDVWAVGYSATGGSSDQALIEHWNGTSWNVIPGA